MLGGLRKIVRHIFSVQAMRTGGKFLQGIGFIRIRTKNGLRNITFNLLAMFNLRLFDGIVSSVWKNRVDKQSAGIHKCNTGPFGILKGTLFICRGYYLVSR